MNKRIEIVNTDNNVEITIKAEPTSFVIYAVLLIVWIVSGLFCVLFFTAFLFNFLIILLLLISWFAGFIMLFFFANWHLCGLEIIKLESGQMFIIKKINALSFRRVFNATKISEIRVTTFRDKLLMGKFEPSLKDLSIYPGNLGFDYDNKTYHFAFQIEHNVAVDIATILTEHLERLKAEN